MGHRVAEIGGGCRVGADGDGSTFSGCDEVNGGGVARCGAEDETFGEDVDLGLGEGDGGLVVKPVVSGVRGV